MLRPKEGANFRYVYYAMLQIGFVPTQHQRHWISKYSHFQIPFLPFPNKLVLFPFSTPLPPPSKTSNNKSQSVANNTNTTATNFWIWKEKRGWK